jgi:hypothetical protein
MVTNSFNNRIFMQPMRRLSRYSKCLHFFSFNFFGGRWRIFIFFPFVPNMFPSSSQWVLIRFPICSLSSQCVPQGCWIGLCIGVQKKLVWPNEIAGCDGLNFVLVILSELKVKCAIY